MRSYTLPVNAPDNPTIVYVNEKKYAIAPGETQNLPEEVVEEIERALKKREELLLEVPEVEYPFVPEGIGGGGPGGGVQSDYLQDDPTAADYIKNRPFYDAGIKTETVIPECAVQFSAAEFGFRGEISGIDTISFDYDCVYIVTLDGTQMELYAEDETQLTCNGCRVWIELENLGIWVETTAAGSHTFMLEKKYQDLKQLNEKFIPNSVIRKDELFFDAVKPGDGHLFTSWSGEVSVNNSIGQGMYTGAMEYYGEPLLADELYNVMVELDNGMILEQNTVAKGSSIGVEIIIGKGNQRIYIRQYNGENIMRFSSNFGSFTGYFYISMYRDLSPLPVSLLPKSALYLESDSGLRFKITVSNDGQLITTPVSNDAPN